METIANARRKIQQNLRGIRDNEVRRITGFVAGTTYFFAGAATVQMQQPVKLTICIAWTNKAAREYLRKCFS